MPLRLLLIGDDTDRTRLLPKQLGDGGIDLDFVQRTDSFGRLHAALVAGPWDLVLCALPLVRLDPRAAIGVVRQYDPQVPLIVAVEEADVAEVLTWIRDGADDVLLGNEASGICALVHPLLDKGSHRSKRQDLLDEPAGSPAEGVALWNATFQQTLVGIGHVGLDGQWLVVNDVLCTMLGYTREELLETSTRRLTHPEDLSAHGEMPNLLLAGKIPTYSVEKRYIHKSGRTVWIHTTISLIRDRWDRPKHFVSVFVDISKRKAAELALIASEERLALVLQGSNDGLWDWNLQTNRVYLSPRWMQILGRPESMAGEVDGDFLLGLIHPDDRMRVMDGFLAHAQGETPSYECEERLLHADGTYRWLLVRGICQLDSDGNPLRMSGTNSDITARKNSEEALRAARATLEVAVTAARVGLWDWNLETGKTNYTESWRRLFGYDVDEFSGTPEQWAKILRPEDHHRLLNGVINALEASGTPEAPAPYEEEYQLRHRDGSERWVLSRISITRNAEGRPQSMIGAHVDITARKHAEDAARRSARRAQAVFAASVDVILIQDADSTIREASPSIRGLLGYEPVELAGRSSFDFVHPDDVDLAREAFRARLVDPTIQTPVEFRVCRKDGSPVYIEATLQNLLDDPDVGGVVSTARNITERKRAAAAHLLEVREEESARLAREIHDQLGQGLTALSMDSAWITKLLSPREDDPVVARVLARLRDMNEQIQFNIAAVRRIATELRPPILDDLGLLPTIEWQVEEFQVRSGIRCEFRAWPALPIPDGIRSTVVLRVLQEALTNVARHAGASRVVIHLNSSNGFLCLEVRDNGRGIDAAKLEMGTSLGIKGMRERAAYVGGEVSIGGSANRGTTVTLRVPQA